MCVACNHWDFPQVPGALPLHLHRARRGRPDDRHGLRARHSEDPRPHARQQLKAGLGDGRGLQGGNSVALGKFLGDFLGNFLNLFDAGSTDFAAVHQVLYSAFHPVIC